MPVPGWTFPSLPGAGAFRSTVPDLLRFLDANLGHQDAGLGRALRLAHTPRTEARGGRVGLGWNLSTVRGKSLAWRSSVTGGYAGFMGFSAEADLGVVVLSDHAGSFLSSLLGRVPVEEPGLRLLTEYLQGR
jgi:CubicO group peptidase (beta-lactamase class C family)